MKKSVIFSAAFAFLLLSAGALRMGLAYRNDSLNIYGRPDLENRFADNGKEDTFDTNDDLRMATWNDDLQEAGICTVYTIIQMPDIPDRPGPACRTIRLPCNVEYYILEDGKFVLERVQPAGSEVETFMWEKNLVVGDSLTSLPSRERGWRMARPFFDGTLASIETSDKSHFYYVRLETLQTIAAELVKTESEYLRTSWDLAESVTPETTNEELARILLFYADAQLYRAGVYCSPDFYRPYFDTLNIVLFSASGMLLAEGIILHRKKTS